MGPTCPHCQVIQEWTEAEITETVYSPRTYMCTSCYGVWTLDVDEVTAVQQHYRPQLDYSRNDELRRDDPKNWGKAWWEYD